MIKESIKNNRLIKPDKTKYLLKGTLIAVIEIIMNTNKTPKRTIKGFGIGLALLFSFMLLSGIDVNSQTMRQERRQDRREDRQERREDRRDARQDGYRDGLREGAEDARARRRANAQAENDYRRAGGENNQRERQAYRTGFIQGYREGYSRYNRSNRVIRNRRGY